MIPRDGPTDDLGVEHRDYATTLFNMAIVWKAKGNLDKALELYEQCRVIKEKVLGVEHHSYATTLFNMALVWEAKGDPGKALELLEQCKVIRERALGANHPLYEKTLRAIAELKKTH